MIADNAKMSVSYAKRLLKDIPADRFARFADGARGPIESNHPAFVLGHLGIYPSRIVADLGGDVSKIAPSESRQQLFGQLNTCQDDPDGTLYPPMEEIVSQFFAGCDAAVEALSQAEDAVFLVENTNENTRSRLPTRGALHAFYMGGHMMMHLGQLSAWRRAVGMPPA